MKNKKLLKLNLILVAALPFTSLLVGCKKTDDSNTNTVVVKEEEKENKEEKEEELEKEMIISETNQLMPVTKLSGEKETINFDELLKQAVIFNWKENNPNLKATDITNIEVKLENKFYDAKKATLNEENVIKGKPYLVHVSNIIVTNPHDDYRTIQTEAFSKAFEVSTTTTVITGFSHKSRMKFGIFDFNIIQPSGQLSYEIKYSDTETRTDTKTELIEIPSQNVPVRPKTSKNAKFYLKVAQIDYKVDLEQLVGGKVNSKIKLENGSWTTYETPIGKVFESLKKYKDLPKITIENDYTVKLKGLAIVSTVKAYDYVVIEDKNIDDITIE